MKIKMKRLFASALLTGLIAGQATLANPDLNESSPDGQTASESKNSCSAKSDKASETRKPKGDKDGCSAKAAKADPKAHPKASKNNCSSKNACAGKNGCGAKSE